MANQRQDGEDCVSAAGLPERYSDPQTVDDYLFDFKAQRSRTCKDVRKRRVDALLRRTRALCEKAGVPVVCAHSMPGLHSTLATGFGATGHAVAMTLGHTSFAATTKRHYALGDLEDLKVLSQTGVLQNVSVHTT